MSHGKYNGLRRKLLREQAIANKICANCLSRPATHGQLCEYCKIAKKKCDVKRWQHDKQACMSHYGNSKCVCCGESEPKFLTIDHINGGGNAHRKEVKAHGSQMYAWLRRNNFPPGYQVLCSNCNSGRLQGLCPHDPNYVKSLDTRYKRYNLKVRIDVMTHYSSDPPMCACCQETNIAFLTIDHINGGGKKHRAGINGSFYKWLRRNDYPSGYQVLCWNCNLAKSNFGQCPH